MSYDPTKDLYGPPVCGNRGAWEKDVRVKIDDTDHIDFYHTVCGERCDTKIDWSDPYSQDGARKTWFLVKCPRCRGCKRWTRLRKMYINRVAGRF